MDDKEKESVELREIALFNEIKLATLQKESKKEFGVVAFDCGAGKTKCSLCMCEKDKPLSEA